MGCARSADARAFLGFRFRLAEAFPAPFPAPSRRTRLLLAGPKGTRDANQTPSSPALTSSSLAPCPLPACAAPTQGPRFSRDRTPAKAPPLRRPQPDGSASRKAAASGAAPRAAARSRSAAST
jgi:hypothetical protein